MDKLLLTVCILAFGLAGFAAAPSKYEKDVIATSQGDLEITFLGHGTLMMSFDGLTIHIDPYGAVADYGALPKADLVLVTHEHSDHLDPAALKAILKPDSTVVASKACVAKFPGAVLLANGESHTVLGLKVEAVPAYNIVHERSKGNPFHPKGTGNGYVVAFGDKRIYIAGDTENTPEMKALKNIDVAFLPMNPPFTMTPAEAAECAKAFKPKIVYPFHHRGQDPKVFAAALAGEPIDVRILNWYPE